VTGLGLILRYHEPITREGAREEAHRELSRDAYRAAEPSLAERLLTWLLDRIGDLFDRAASASPGGGLGLLAIAAVVVLLVVAVLMRFGPLSRSAARPTTGRSRTGSPPRGGTPRRYANGCARSSGTWRAAVPSSRARAGPSTSS
jgi:hypothetical protein